MVMTETVIEVAQAIEHVPKSASEIKEETSLGKSAIYKALNSLRDYNLIDTARKGRAKAHKLNVDVDHVKQAFQGGGGTTTTSNTGGKAQANSGKQTPSTGSGSTATRVNGHGIRVVDYDVDTLKEPKSVLDDYVHRQLHGVSDFDLLDAAQNNDWNILFQGPKGSGKSKTCRAYAAARELPYFRINLDGMATAEDLIGQWVRSGGEWAWEDGIVTMAMRHGGVLVVDEINAGSRDVLFVLNSVLDDDRQLLLRNKDNEVVNAHSEFLVVANMNPNYAGTRPLNQALEDRFDVNITVDYDRSIEGRIIDDGNLREFARNVRRLHEEGDIARPISTRALLQFEELRDRLNEEIAIESMTMKFEKEDRDAVREAAEQYLSREEDEEVLIDDEDSDDNNMAV